MLLWIWKYAHWFENTTASTYNKIRNNRRRPARCPLLLTILKRIYKNYKEKSSFLFAHIYKYIYIYLPAQKKSDEFSSQHGLN